MPYYSNSNCSFFLRQKSFESEVPQAKTKLPALVLVSTTVNITISVLFYTNAHINHIIK